MTLYPDVVRLAQQELDEVLCRERLPDPPDKPRLPYISAITKEVLRWGPPTPLGTALPCDVLFCVNYAELASGSAHQVAEDDVYRGFFIPAGATVIENIWYVIRVPEAHSCNRLNDGKGDVLGRIGVSRCAHFQSRLVPQRWSDQP